MRLCLLIKSITKFTVNTYNMIKCKKSMRWNLVINNKKTFLIHCKEKEDFWGAATPYMCTDL